MATVTRTSEVGVLTSRDNGSGYVDWGAIFAGAAVATAISMIFFAFGSALGLSLTSFSDRPSMPGMGIVIAVGLWLLWLQITASAGGGYVAGRLRRRISDAPSHETEMRDGMHGLVVWAVGALLGALIAASVAAIGAMGTATVAAGAASNPEAADMSGYYVDRLLRTTATAPAGASTDAATGAPPPAAEGAATGSPAAGQPVSADVRNEFGRLLSTGGLSAADSEDRGYLIERLVATTGLSQEAATQRLDTTLAAMKARADQARRMGVLMAFITIASLLISAVASWWAATMGGSHRDEFVDHSRFVSWRRTM